MAPSSGGRSTRGGCAIPELPEVETVRRELAAWLPGRTITAADLVDAAPGPKYAGLERAVGQRIARVERIGKFLLLPLERGDSSAQRDELIIHLGMTGVLSAPAPAGHLRVRLTLDGPPPRTLHFRDVRRFGRFLVSRAGCYEALPTLRTIGPDALADAFTPERLRRELAGTSVAIKRALLSQRPVAGVGNIYADEALWRASVHPLRPARELRRGQVEALWRALRSVLEAAVEAQGTTLYDYRTVRGEVGGYLEHLAVYGRAGHPCPRCGTPFERMLVAARGTHYCPRCQRRPRLADRGRRRSGAR